MDGSWLVVGFVLLAVLPLVVVVVAASWAIVAFEEDEQEDFMGMPLTTAAGTAAWVRVIISPVRSLRGSAGKSTDGLTSEQLGWKVRQQLLAIYASCTDRPIERRRGMPMLLTHVLSFGRQMRLLAAPSLTFNLIGSVHMSIDVVQNRRIDFSSTFRSQVAVTGFAPHRRGTVLDMTVKLWRTIDTAGEPPSLVLRNRFLFFHRRPRSAGGESKRSTAREDHHGDLKAGSTAETSLTVTSYNTDLWAALTGDYNPIHTSDWAAAALGLGPKRIAHGVCVLDLALPWLLQQAAKQLAEPPSEDDKESLEVGSVPDSMLPLRLRCRFTKPAPVPSTDLRATLVSPESRFRWEDEDEKEDGEASGAIGDASELAAEVGAVRAVIGEQASTRPTHEVLLTWGDAKEAAD